jgi:hypothetical protein
MVDTKCLPIGQGLVGAFSGTYNCQNWATEKRQVYSGTIPDGADLPKCYDLEGKNVFANYFGASTGSVDNSGTYVVTSNMCDTSHHLICIEQ